MRLANECAQHARVADGCMPVYAAVDRARSTHATVEAAGRVICQLGWRFFFFFFGSADPRIFEDSNGSSADPDRSGFRWIRFTPTQNIEQHWRASCTVTRTAVVGDKRRLRLRFVLPLFSPQNKVSTLSVWLFWFCVCGSWLLSPSLPPRVSKIWLWCTAA